MKRRCGCVDLRNWRHSPFPNFSSGLTPVVTVRVWDDVMNGERWQFPENRLFLHHDTQDFGVWQAMIQNHIVCACLCLSGVHQFTPETRWRKRRCDYDWEVYQVNMMCITTRNTYRRRAGNFHWHQAKMGTHKEFSGQKWFCTMWRPVTQGFTFPSVRSSLPLASPKSYRLKLSKYI